MLSMPNKKGQQWWDMPDICNKYYLKYLSQPHTSNAKDRVLHYKSDIYIIVLRKARSED